MRTQPKHYVKLTCFGLMTIISLDDISRIDCPEVSDENAVERCIRILYTDDHQHILESAEILGNHGEANRKVLFDALYTCLSLVNHPKGDLVDDPRGIKMFSRD